MWIVFFDEGTKLKKFDSDEEAERFMLAYLEDESIFPNPNRDLIRSQLNESYQRRSQLREGWGVFPYVVARWVDL